MAEEKKNPFVFIPATDASKEKIKTNLEKCSDLHDFLLSLPECRERSLAITKLEEAAMWANKAIAFTQDR